MSYDAGALVELRRLGALFCFERFEEELCELAKHDLARLSAMLENL